MRSQRFTLLIALVLFGIGVVSAANSVDVRLSHNALNQKDHALYVDIEVRVDNTNRIVLAGQNYRIYYPSDLLSLDEKKSKSQLSPKNYSNLKFASVLENIQAAGQGALNFDRDLGFANFSVDLLDSKRGGDIVTSNDGWVTIATLKFDVLTDFNELTMIWGREGMSEKYATAFVEIAEWKAPFNTDAVNIDEYIDFNLSINRLNIDDATYEISVGPNPAVDFIEIKSDKSVESDLLLTFRDLTGRLIKRKYLSGGSNFYNVDVSELQSASYILEMSNPDGHGLYSQKVVVAR